MNKSIFNKIAGKYYLLNIILLIAILSLFIFYINDSYDSGFINSYDSFSDMVTVYIGHELTHENSGDLNKVFKRYFIDKNIIGYAYYDTLGERTFAENLDSAVVFPALFPGELKKVTQDKYYIYKKIDHLKASMGYMAFVVKKDNFIKRLSKNGPIYILLLISLAGLFFISSVIFHNLIISPITELINFSQKLIDNKDYSTTIEPSGTKDIQLLGRLLNTLTEDIHTFKAESISKTKAIQENEIKYRNLFNSASDSIFLMDGNKFIDCNDKTLDLFECTREQIIGTSPSFFSPPKQPNGQESLTLTTQKIKAALEGEPQFFEWVHCTFSKEIFDAEVSLNRIQIKGNYYLQAIVRDITKRKKFENTITDIVKNTSTIFGDEYFKAVARNLTNILKSDFTLVGKISEKDGNKIDSLAFFSQKKELEQITYELNGTPCESVVGRSICVYCDNVAELFPKDILLKERGIRGYAGIPLFDSQKKPIGIILTMTLDKIDNPDYFEKILQLFANRTSAEIERMNAEKELAYSRNMLKNVLDTIPVRVFWKDLNSRYLGHNKMFAQDADIKDGETLIGKHDSELIWKDQYEQYVSNDKKVIESNKALLDFEETFDRSGKQKMWIKKSKIPLKDTDDNTIGILGCYEDITEQKEIERALKESEARYRILFEKSPISIALHYNNETLFLNQAAKKTLDITDDSDFLNKGPIDFVHKDFHKVTIERFKKLTSGEVDKIKRVEDKLVTVKNRVIDVESTSTIIEYEGKRAIMTTFIDITEQKQAREELRKSQEIMQAITDNTKSMIAVKDRDGKYLMVNKQFEEAFGGDVQNLVDKTVYDLFPKHLADKYTSHDQMVFKTKTQKTFEEEIDFKNETKVYMVVKYPLLDEKGNPYALCDLTTDITERKMREKEENKIEKLQSVGLLAGGIAHDFNNFLTGILGSISLALMDIEPNSELYQNLTDAEKATIRARDLTQQLLTFSKGGNPVRESSSIIDLVKDTANFSLRGSKVNLVIKSDEIIKPVNIDTGQISQVIQNLVINASQAMPEGGSITIDLKSVLVDSNNNLPILEGEYIKISIIDEGIGISEKHLEKIFDPYFTTKQHGNGLGLATCYSIIKKHEGHIEASSTIGAGTTFTIYLPVSNDIVSRNEDKEIKPEEKRAKILVMDDEFFIRDLTKKMLGRYKHEVLAVEDGEQAVIAYRKALDSNKPFDIVLLDLTIPGGMGGKETIEALKEIDPGVKAIVCSGYSNDPIMADYDEYGFSGFIGKPYKPKELQKVVQKILSEKNKSVKA